MRNFDTLQVKKKKLLRASLTKLKSEIKEQNCPKCDPGLICISSRSYFFDGSSWGNKGSVSCGYIKRSPSIKRSLVTAPVIASLNICKLNLY